MDATSPHTPAGKRPLPRLVDALQIMEAKFGDWAQGWTVLTESGGLRDITFAELFQQATTTQDLSREVLQLTAELATIPLGANGPGHGAVLQHLVTASTMSSYAATYFAEAAESELGRPRASTPVARHDAEHHIIRSHATGRAYLRLTSRCLRDTITELEHHRDEDALRLAPAHQAGVVPPPVPRGHHR